MKQILTDDQLYRRLKDVLMDATPAELASAAEHILGATVTPISTDEEHRQGIDKFEVISNE